LASATIATITYLFVALAVLRCEPRIADREQENTVPEDHHQMVYRRRLLEYW
jgi:hypothetical protein